MTVAAAVEEDAMTRSSLGGRRRESDAANLPSDQTLQRGEFPHVLSNAGELGDQRPHESGGGLSGLSATERRNVARETHATPSCPALHGRLSPMLQPGRRGVQDVQGPGTAVDDKDPRASREAAP